MSKLFFQYIEIHELREGSIISYKMQKIYVIFTYSLIFATDLNVTRTDMITFFYYYYLYMEKRNAT